MLEIFEQDGEILQSQTYFYSYKKKCH